MLTKEKELMQRLWLQHHTQDVATLLAIAETWHDELVHWREDVAETSDAAMSKIHNLEQNLEEAYEEIKDLTNDILRLNNRPVGSILREVAAEYEEMKRKLDTATRDERNANAKMKEYKEKLGMWNAVST